MSPDLQEILALAIVAVVVVLNLWWRRRRKREDPEALADCAGCPKGASEPTESAPRLVQLGARDSRREPPTPRRLLPSSRAAPDRPR